MYYILFMLYLTKVNDSKKKKENKENSKEKVKKGKVVCLIFIYAVGIIELLVNSAHNNQIYYAWK